MESRDLDPGGDPLELSNGPVRSYARLAAVLLSAGWLLAACTPKTPDIDVVGDYNMGSVTKGAQAVAEIPVRNLGTGTLNIVAVSTSCGCTTATLTPMSIEPGAEARLRVVYDSGAHEMDLGTIERQVFIASDDPIDEEVRINLAVIVTAPGS